MSNFKANVQYGDWKGTAAADNADFEAMSGHLQKVGLLSSSEFLVGFEAYVGTPTLNSDPYFSASAFIVEAGDYEGSLQKVLAQEPVEVFRKELELGILDFFKLFKRFDLVLTHRGLDLEGREYREIE
jgi:hypothetical protein